MNHLFASDYKLYYHTMDQISVESSESENSSCSFVSYEGTDGYISDGEDPFFILPPEGEENQFEEQYEESLSSDSDDDSNSEKSKTETDYSQKRIERQKKNNVKEIMDELKFGRNTTMLLNKNPLVPTYDEIMKMLNDIKRKFPKRSLEKIIEKLNWELIEKPKYIVRQQILQQRNPPKPKTTQQKQKREFFLRQREIAALTFCQQGYGITRMRKYVEQSAINIQIDIKVYEEIIKKLVLDAYHRLERFLRKKCHKSIKSLKNETEEKFLLECLKNCKHRLDTFEMHNFYKLIKLTYLDQKMKISKRIASRLYHTCQEYIMRKKLKTGYMDPDNPESEIYNTDKLKWDESMIEMAVDIYIKEGSLNRIREIMAKTCNIDEVLLDNRNIKYHIENKVKTAMDILKGHIEKSKKEYSGVRIKEMVPLDDMKMKWILNSIHATNVRVILCELYKTKQLTQLLLNQAILAINEFLLKKETDEMLQQIKRRQREYNPRVNQFKSVRRKSKHN